ncbi:MAG: hypothetical protein WD176_04530, partial [Pirellulales bacterium]
MIDVEPPTQTHIVRYGYAHRPKETFQLSLGGGLGGGFGAAFGGVTGAALGCLVVIVLFFGGCVVL